MLRHRLAFGFNFIAILGFVLMGLVYSLSPVPMPYHLRILGADWDLLPQVAQMLILALLHGSGLATLSASASLMLILWIPWRQRQRWALIALPVVALSTNLLLLLVMLQLQAQAGQPTPWPLLLGPIVLLSLGALLSSRP